MHLGKYRQKGNGLYILSKNEIDEIAMDILTSHAPYAVKFPQSVDITQLATEGFYLDISHRYLRPDGKLLGMIALLDVKDCKLIDLDYQELSIDLSAGSVLIDTSLIDSMFNGRHRFTEAHELAHWILHRSFVDPNNRQYEYRKANIPLIACREENIEQNRKHTYKWDDLDWMEWQADNLAAAILMPKEMFIEAFKSAMLDHGFGIQNYLIKDKDITRSKSVIKELSNVFQVSNRAIQLRLLRYDLIRTNDNRYY